MRRRASPPISPRTTFSPTLLARALGGACLLVATFPTLAADAGQLLQQIENERQPQLPQKSAPTAVQEPTPERPKESTKVTITSFSFTGNSIFPESRLSAVVACYINRPITLSELQEAAAKIAELYRNEGWVVRSFLPPQDVQNGNVTIQVIEGTFGSSILEGKTNRLYKTERIYDAVSATQAKGKPLNTNKLDRTLLIMDDLPGVVASGSLKSGANPRETDVVIKIAEEPWLNGDAQIDNTGSRSTGSNRISGNFYLNSPTHIGDQVIVNSLFTEGSEFLRLAYSLPIGYDGWRIGASTSSMNYKLITSEFDGKNGKGNSRTFGGDASYAFIRSRTQNLYLALNLDQKTFDNQLSGSTTSQYDVTSLGMGLNGNLFDEILGGGVNSANLIFTQGNVGLGTLDSNESADVGGTFRKIRYGINRQQFITDKSTFYAALTSQQSSDILDSSEKFYLGGANGVRAFPSSEGGGASGNMINLELRTRFPKGFLLTGFYDYGDMRNNDNSKSYSLKGAGLSLAWQADFGLMVKATLARRLGENPNLTSAGNDQDGSKIDDRLWLVASIPFSFTGSSGKSVADGTPASTPSTTPQNTSPQPSVPQASASVKPTPTGGKEIVADSATAGTATRLRRNAPLVSTGMKQKSAALSADTQTMLDEVAQELLANPKRRIEISGHTDKTKVSKAPYNVRLSLQRATAVEQYLIRKGVPANQIIIVGYGFNKPIASNKTASGRDKNRRVEIELLN